MEQLIKAWETAHWELGEAFKGMPDEDLWTRPHPSLWSVGELGCHLGLWESINYSGGAIKTPFMIAAAKYYTPPLPDPIVLDMSAEAAYAEVQRVHKAALQEFEMGGCDPTAKNPFRENWTWAETVEYGVIHTAYHTGQIYSARHMLGHQTEDN
jgi:uncharacterized damage-inducible protein DinB